MCRKIDPIISSIVFIPIRPTEKGLIGFVNLTYNNQLALNGAAVYTRPSGEGYRLVYPINKALAFETHYFCPLNSEIGDIMIQAVSVKVNDVINKMGE